eukprot:1144547-Pelagomonas_calceolata.AAC.2
MEGAFQFMTFWERAYKARGSFQADRMCNSLSCGLHTQARVLHARKISSILKVWEAYQIGNGVGSCRCTRSCLFSSQPSNIVEGVGCRLGQH